LGGPQQSSYDLLSAAAVSQHHKFETVAVTSNDYFLKSVIHALAMSRSTKGKPKRKKQDADMAARDGDTIRSSMKMRVSVCTSPSALELRAHGRVV
jgi:hypothetical protein